MFGEFAAALTASARNSSRIGTAQKINTHFLLLSTAMFHVEHFFDLKTAQVFHVEHISMLEIETMFHVEHFHTRQQHHGRRAKFS
jgi:hypothetical protein